MVEELALTSSIPRPLASTCLVRLLLALSLLLFLAVDLNVLCSRVLNVLEPLFFLLRPMVSSPLATSSPFSAPVPRHLNPLSTFTD
ncbi:hypothetical protein C8J56DRAFT_978331 [Mycena floridula]|nr:hypothetical protein C8J56DRAFT_978331 [Mycena floridula]